MSETVPARPGPTMLDDVLGPTALDDGGGPGPTMLHGRDAPPGTTVLDGDGAEDLGARPEWLRPAGAVPIPCTPARCAATDAGPSRRQVLTWAGAGAATLVLAACGGDAEPGPPPDVEPGERLVSLSEIDVGSSRAVRTADGAELLVTRVGEAEVVAFSAVCTHQGCTVAAEAGRLACPCHGSVYDPATGAVLEGPAPEPLPQIPVRIDGDAITTA